MRNIHLIVAGNESIEKHTGGLELLKPYRVVLFDVAGDVESEKIDKLMQLFKDGKVHAKKKKLPTKYGEIFLPVLGEVAGLRGLDTDINFAVNVSTGRRLAVAAIEDAVRSPLGGDVIIEAHSKPGGRRHSIRYEVTEKDGDFMVQMAPLQGTEGLPMGEAYKMMPFKRRDRLEKLEILPDVLPLKFRFLKNKWKRRLGLR